MSNWATKERIERRELARTPISSMVYEKDNVIVIDGQQEQWLKFVGENNEFLFFACSFYIKKLRGRLVLLIDGTFLSASLEFKQHLIITQVKKHENGDEYTVPLCNVSKI